MIMGDKQAARIGNFDCSPNAPGMLSNLSPSARKALEAVAHTATYPRGAVLFSEQEEAPGVYAIRKGCAKIMMTSPSGHVVILRIARPGEILGLQAVVSNQKFETSAEIVEPTEIEFVRRDSFLNVLREHPDAALLIAKQLSYECRQAEHLIRSLGLSHSAPKKLAAFLLDWTAGIDLERVDNRATLALTHEEIGEMIGTSRETVTRAFSDFRQRKLATMKGATLLIQNRPALELYAQI
jgi:CRP/FNR family transcriptional regulator